MIDRRNRELTRKDIAKIADTVAQFEASTLHDYGSILNHGNSNI